MDAWLFFVLFGAVLVVNELGRLLPGRPPEGRFSRRTMLLINGAWYAGVALLIVGWWFGSDFASSMLFAVFVVSALFAGITVLLAISLVLRVASVRLGRR